jgi:uncharacterized membrane protein
MKTVIPASILMFLYYLFLVCVFLSPLFLPENLATSFNFAGEPECWMSRTSYMLFVSGMGSLVIIAIAIIGLLCAYLPAKWCNVPHRDYWFAPERRVETKRYIFQQMLWFDCLLSCFLIAVHFSTIHANKIMPQHLPGAEFFSIVSCFVAGTLIWVLMLLLHFARTDR